jgi:5-methylcytosine-specific restriction endonuclease McrA
VPSRDATPDRIRGRALQRIRARVLRREPRCVSCLAKGRVSPAVEVDHIVPLFKGGDDDPHDDANRAGLCSACHAAKTALDLGYRVRPRIGADGYPLPLTHAHGEPEGLDPADDD